LQHYPLADLVQLPLKSESRIAFAGPGSRSKGARTLERARVNSDAVIYGTLHEYAVM
jgi:hypothetical protein